MSITIISKKYEHFNRPMGIYIRGKHHYQEEMKKRGFVSLEEGNRLAEQHNKEMTWKPSKDCLDMVKAINNSSNRKNGVVLAHYPKVVEAMKKKGVTFDMNKINKHIKEAEGNQNAL